MAFASVKAILDSAIAGWNQDNNGQDPDLSGHGASFSWHTRDALLAAVGHGKRLIQPEVIGNNKGDQANLVIDLRVGFSNLRMPLGGPYLGDAQITEIVDWINAGCPDDPPQGEGA